MEHHQPLTYRKEFCSDLSHVTHLFQTRWLTPLNKSRRKLPEERCARGARRGGGRGAPRCRGRSCPLSGGSAAGRAARGAQGAACAGRERGRRAGNVPWVMEGAGSPGEGAGTAPVRGQQGPPQAERCGRCAGTRAAPRPPPLGERRPGKGDIACASPRGGPGGTAPTAPLRAGSRGRALSPTASRGGQRSPQPAQSGGGAGCAGPRSGPAPWQGWRGRNAIGVLRCPPSVPRQGRRALTAPHRAHRGTQSKPGLPPACPCRLGPRRCLC